MPNKRKPGLLIVLMAASALAACLPVPSPPAPTATPDPCTGWNCTLSGVVYRDLAGDDNRLAAIPITLEQFSHCSPTAGQQHTITSEDGGFAFEVFLHDTDSFVITIDQQGFESFKTLVGGFGCLSCFCSPIEIILDSE